MQYRGISNIRIIRTGVYLDTVRSSGSMRGAVVGVSSLVYERMLLSVPLIH